MMDKNEEEKLDRLFDFFREIDKEKLITRQTHVTAPGAWRTMRNMPGIWPLWLSCFRNTAMRKSMC